MPARQSYVADRKVVDACRDALILALGRLWHSHRTSANLTQSELGKAVGINQAFVSAVENGATVHADHVKKTAERVGVDERYVQIYVAAIG